MVRIGVTSIHVVAMFYPLFLNPDISGIPVSFLAYTSTCARTLWFGLVYTVHHPASHGISIQVLCSVTFASISFAFIFGTKVCPHSALVQVNFLRQWGSFAYISCPLDIVLAPHHSHGGHSTISFTGFGMSDSMDVWDYKGVVKFIHSCDVNWVYNRIQILPSIWRVFKDC